MHHIVVWFIVRQMKHHPGHCIALYASAKKALRENLKMGKEWRGLFLFEPLPKYFVPSFFFYVFFPFFIYEIMCPIQFWGT